VLHLFNLRSSPLRLTLGRAPLCIYITGTQRRPQVKSPSSIFEQYDPRAEPQLKSQVNLSLLRRRVSQVELTDGRGEGEGRGRSQILRRRESLIPYKSFNSLWLALPRSTFGSRVNSCTKKSKWKYARRNLKQNKLLYQHIVTGKYFIHIFLQKKLNRFPNKILSYPYYSPLPRPL
jgi:hypothetical protein